MPNASVIKEFLVSLGFKTDEKSLKSFTDGVSGATKAVAGLVASIEVAALAVGAKVSSFASNMDALYFAVQRTGSSAVNLKALEYSAKNLGASADEARGAVEGLARFMRDVPAGEGFLNALGVDTRDANNELRDTSDMMVDLGKKMSQMPWYQAKAYAGQLGISDNMLRALRDGTFAEGVRQYKEMNSRVDFDGAAEKAHRYEMKLAELEARMKGLGITIGSALIDALGPKMEAATQWFEKNGDKVADVVSGIATAIVNIAAIMMPILGKIAEGWENIYGWVKLAGEKINEVMPKSWGEKIGAGTAWLFDKLGIRDQVDKAMGIDGDQSQAAPASQSGAKDRLAQLEKQYGLPAGLLDSVWNAESGRGKNMRSTAGAEGHFQFMPGTAKQYGLKNPYDFDQSSEAAAQYYRDLFKKYGGNLEKAVAAYNWGPGNVDRNGLGALPAETRNYLDKVKRGMSESVQVTQTTNINVQGGGDPAATGRAVAGEQGRVNQQMARNLQSAVS